MPSVRTDGGMSYEEGEGLEQDEVEFNQGLLPRTLAMLPGGGIKHGVVVYVEDQGQALSLEMHVSHQVCRLCFMCVLCGVPGEFDRYM
jgi:hypothetical protein